MAYVTKEVLQRRYPPSLGAFSTHYSSIELKDSAIISSPRKIQKKTSFILINVGTMAQLYKGQAVLIDAVAKCVKNGLDLELILLGDGKHRKEFQAQVEAGGLSNRVAFKGQLPVGEAIRNHLDRDDLFVLP